MEKLNYYYKLNDYLDSDELKKEFENFFTSERSLSALEILEALSELSIRKERAEWQINDELRSKATAMVLSCWDEDSECSTELFTEIIFNLELKVAFNVMRSKLTKISNYKVRHEIESTISDAKNGPPPLKYW